MSTTVYSYGLIACLTQPVPSKDHEDVIDRLYSANAGLELTSCGELIYWDQAANLPYNKREFCGDLLLVVSPKVDRVVEFAELVRAQGLDIDQQTVRPFHCIWYNGCESPMSNYTKEKLLSGETS